MQIKFENIVPMQKFVLIKPLEAPTQTSMGLDLPEERNVQTPVLGEILKTGQESRFKQGQLVFFRRYSYDELKFKTEEGTQIVSLLSDDEVVAIIETPDDNAS